MNARHTPSTGSVEVHIAPKPFTPSSAPNVSSHAHMRRNPTYQHQQQHQHHLGVSQSSGKRSHSASSVGSAVNSGSASHRSDVNSSRHTAHHAAGMVRHGHTRSSGCAVVPQMHVTPTDAQKRSELVQDPQTKSKFRAFCSVLRKKEKDVSFEEAYKYGHEGFT